MELSPEEEALAILQKNDQRQKKKTVSARATAKFAEDSITIPDETPMPAETPLPPSPPPARRPPPKTDDEIYREKIVEKSIDMAFNGAKQETARKAARMNAETSRKVPVGPPRPPSDGTKRSVDLNRILNYKLKYETKIAWTFKEQQYYERLNDEALLAELANIRLVINDAGAPEAMRGAFLKLFSGLEFVTVSLLGMPFLGGENRVSLTGTIEKSMNNGFFDEEFDQLEVEYRHLFAMSPGLRLAHKLALVGKEVVGHNVPLLYRPAPSAAAKMAQYLNRDEKK